jgi:cytochrome c peroxidase
MRKLKLESLTVESFETAAAMQSERGTVQAHAKPQPTTLQTYNVDVCGDTMYFDCTLGCSHLTNCSQCWNTEICLEP